MGICRYMCASSHREGEKNNNFPCNSITVNWEMAAPVATKRKKPEPKGGNWDRMGTPWQKDQHHKGIIKQKQNVKTQDDYTSASRAAASECCGCSGVGSIALCTS